MFELNNQLKADTHLIGDMELTKVLLMNDSRYPWVILVPRREDITEIHQLNQQDRKQLMEESCFVSEFIENNFRVIKMNVGALGNIVSQLHVHHIGRHEKDPAWPGPVWGHSAAEPYKADALQQQLELFSGLPLITY